MIKNYNIPNVYSKFMIYTSFPMFFGVLNPNLALKPTKIQVLYDISFIFANFEPFLTYFSGIF